MENTKRTASQALRFLMVSTVSLGIDYAVYSLLSAHTSIGSSWAKRASFLCIIIWGFFAHKHFTFRRQTRFNAGEPLRFAMLYLSGWLINSTVHDLAATDPSSSNPAFLAATFVWACWNFIGQKFFVFGRLDKAA